MSGATVSRRDLLGAGLLRRAREVPTEPEVRWGPGPEAPVPEAVRAVAAACGPGAVLVVDGPGPLADALPRAWVPACRHLRLPAETGTVDTVASCFGVVHAGSMREVGLELHRVLRPGGALAMAVWSGTGPMRPALGTARRWGTYDGLVLALDRFAGFEADERGDWTLVRAEA